MDWLHGPPGHMPDRVDPVVQEVINELRGPLGCKRVGGVGYCFGAKYVIRFLKEGHLDAGFVAHPSFVEAEELEAVQKPLSIAAAGTLQPVNLPLLLWQCARCRTLTTLPRT